MADDKYDILGPLYSEIGGELARIVGGDPDGVYLYAEAGQGWVGASVFKDEGTVVRYFNAGLDLCDLIMDAWEAQEPGKRWAVMEYTITGTSFDVKFKYPEEIDPAQTEVERRPAALKARYGDKPVVYPPEPPGMMEYKVDTD
ncbi:MAG TPA: hypothetical protein VM657_00905 [Sphingomonas sp.]|nr:hypothetical protein [Sphingomonas sp.]